jgi:putative solute:sodium symporter small subunit
MSDSSNDYHISFFKPTTPQAVANRNIIVWLILIWFVAIFGFHILLRVIEKPVPEPAYNSFIKVWDKVQKGNASYAEIQEFGKSTLMVFGKSSITAEERNVLKESVSWSLLNLTTDSLRSNLISSIQNFEKIQGEITNIAEPNYVKAKKELNVTLCPMLDLDKQDVRTTILPLALTSTNIENLTDDTKSVVPGIMEKYLIHNRSVLTDTRFLGFPFHYFYSAVFLLILFVGLCWIYCVKTDKLNSKFNIAD